MKKIFSIALTILMLTGLEPVVQAQNGIFNTKNLIAAGAGLATAYFVSRPFFKGYLLPIVGDADALKKQSSILNPEELGIRVGLFNLVGNQSARNEVADKLKNKSTCERLVDIVVGHGFSRLSKDQKQKEIFKIHPIRFSLGLMIASVFAAAPFATAYIVLS